MAKTITTRVLLTGKDVLSPVVASAVGKSMKSIETLEQRANRFAGNAFSAGRSSFAAGVAFAAPITYAAKEAAKFEDELTSLGKVLDMDIGSKELKALGQEAKRFSEYTGEGANAAVQMYTNLAQAGIAKNELVLIAKDVANIGIAFDTVSDVAGESYVKIKNAIGYTIPETKLLFDAVNYLSDQTASKASELVTFLQNGGAGVARSFGVAGKDIAAFGATLISSGKSAEESATVVERMAKNIFTHKGLLDAYKQGGRGLGGFINVLQKGNKIMDPDRQTAYFQQFGEYGNQIRQLSLAMNDKDGLLKTLKLVANEQTYVGSVQMEATRKMGSTLRQWNQLTTMVKNGIIDFGDAVLPTIREFVKEAKPVVQTIGNWARENPELVLTGMKVVATMSALSFATAGLAFTLGGVVRVFTFYKTIVGAFAAEGAVTVLAGQISTLTTSLWGMATATTVLGAPVWLVAAAVVGIGYAFYTAYDKVEWFHAAIIRVTTNLQTLVEKVPLLWDALAEGDFSKAWRIGKSWQAQNELNVKQHMDEWRANRPDAYKPVASGFWEGKEANRAAHATDWKKTDSYILGKAGVEAKRKAAQDNLERGAFNFLSENSNAQRYAGNYLPSAVPQNTKESSGKSSIIIRSNPVINIGSGGTVSDADKAKLMEAMGWSTDEMARQIKQVLREQDRTKLK